MIEAQVNYFDVAVLSIIVLSCLFALFRGFVKEILSLIAWVGAAYITAHFFEDMVIKLKPHFVSPMLAASAATFILYVGSLIGFAIINSIIVRILKSGSGMGFVDNFLGFIFGALRGAFIVSIGFIMMSLVITEDNRPEWLEKAFTRPYVEKTASLLVKAAPTYFAELVHMQEKAQAEAKDPNSKMNNYIREQLGDKLNNPENMQKLGEQLGVQSKEVIENNVPDVNNTIPAIPTIPTISNVPKNPPAGDVIENAPVIYKQ